jgi:hypothetical protein
MVSDNERERVRLVEVDYANTSEFIKSVVTTGATIRGLAVTIWLALVGFSVQQGLWELAALAGIVAAVFWLLDGYHGWLCAEALTHARAAEKVTSLYYNALSRGEDSERALTGFRTELRTYRFGLYLNIRAFRLGDLLLARPRVFYLVLYPVLIALAVAALGLVAAGTIGAASNGGGASAGSLVIRTKHTTGTTSTHITTNHSGTRVDVLIGPNTYVSISPAVNIKDLTLSFVGKGSGERGERGRRGERGPAGPHGPKGATGPRGQRGFPGTSAPAPGS